MKAVAEARKMDKGEDSRLGPPAWLAGPLGWGPKKFTELKAFFSEVRSELKKVTWPAKKEVYSTTIVVLITTVFFGFYLYGLDLLMSQVFTRILRH
ncbi:MAG TPA: preprotein translocase subunit SecE [Vicinamibacteria bacterium]|nr:preprotein translocase subunit SecE [Vicinamibacteria bacterium]